MGISLGLLGAISGASCATMAAATFSFLTWGLSDHLAIGGLVGYDFGAITLSLIAAQSVYATDDVRGLSVWTRVTFGLWGPDAPTPPAAKRSSCASERVWRKLHCAGTNVSAQQPTYAAV